MWPFSKKQVQEVEEIETVIGAVIGHEIKVIAGSANISYQRNIERIERIKLVLKKLQKNDKLDTKRAESFQLELERRRLAIRQYELTNEVL